MHFTPAETKASFASHFLRFAAVDFPKHHFTLRFYRQIMNTFGMIAHYDSTGFWTEYFTSTAGKIEFLEQVLSWNSYYRMARQIAATPKYPGAVANSIRGGL